MGVLARSEALVAAITETVHLVPSLLCLGNIQESNNLLLEKSLLSQADVQLQEPDLVS